MHGSLTLSLMRSSSEEVNWSRRREGAFKLRRSELEYKERMKKDDMWA
jgi:hypothetical protein